MLHFMMWLVSENSAAESAKYRFSFFKIAVLSLDVTGTMMFQYIVAQDKTDDYVKFAFEGCEGSTAASQSLEGSINRAVMLRNITDVIGDILAQLIDPVLGFEVGLLACHIKNNDCC